MKRQLAGTRAIVTGASGGIGRRLAAELAARGAKVALAARSADKLAELAGQLRHAGHEALAVPCDLTVPADREKLVHTVADAWGGLDVLVNNAGVASWGHFATSDEAILRRVMEVNFFAPAELIRLAVPLLMKGRDPVVVNVGSLCGRRGLPGWSEHSGSKHALTGLTEALRGEFARFGIDVLLVVPGLVRSDDLGRHLLRRDGRANLDFANATPPERVAGAIVRALQTRRRETLVGRDARLLILANRLLPRLVGRLLARKVTALYAPDAGRNG